MTKRPSPKAGRGARSGGPEATPTADAAPATEPGAVSGSGTVIVTDEVSAAPPAATSAPRAAPPERRSTTVPAVREAAAVDSKAESEGRATDASTETSADVSEGTPASPATTGPVSAETGGSRDTTAAATVESARETARSEPQPRVDSERGSSALTAAVVSAIVVAGLLVAYDAFVRGDSGVEGSVAALEDRLAGAEGVAAEAQSAAAAARETAQTAVAQAQAAPDDERLAALEERLDAVAADASEAARSVEAAPDAAGLTALEERLSALDARIDTEIAPALADVEASGLEAAQDAARAAATEVRDALAAESAALRDEIAALDQRMTAQAEETRRAYLGITAANAVFSALPAGAPYSGALETLEAAGVDGEILSALAPFAETGAPTADDLRSRFAEVAPEIRRALMPEDVGDGVGSFFEGLFARAVRVEPIDGLETELGQPAIDPSADVARALTVGDVEAAFSAWQALPQAARDVSDEFGALLGARIRAGDAARDAVDQARAALSPQAQ